MLKITLICAVIVLTIGGTIKAQHHLPTITSQNQNIYRTYGNLGQIATQSKTINTPYSSVSKSDVRVSNPGYSVASVAQHAPVPAIYHGGYPAAAPAPIYHGGYVGPAAPIYNHGYAAKSIVGPPAALLGVAYSPAPAVAHMTYSNGLGYNYAW